MDLNENMHNSQLINLLYTYDKNNIYFKNHSNLSKYIQVCFHLNKLTIDEAYRYSEKAFLRPNAGSSSSSSNLKFSSSGSSFGICFYRAKKQK